MGTTIRSESLIYVVFKTQSAPHSLPNYDTYSVWTKTSVYIFLLLGRLFGWKLKDFHNGLELILFSLFCKTTDLSDFGRDIQANLLNQVSQKKVFFFFKCERFTNRNIPFRLLIKTRQMFSRPITRMCLQKNRLLFLAENETCSFFE
jgi:hypothetical protein